MKLEDLKVACYILYLPDFLPKSHMALETVTLESRTQRKGADKWGIFKLNRVLYKSDKEFGYEGQSSSRSDGQLSDTRFKSAQEALDFWQQIHPAYDKVLREKAEQMKEYTIKA